MKLFKRVGALALTLALAAGCLTGCGEQAAPKSDFVAPESIDLTTLTEPYTAISGLTGDTVMATAGDVEITLDHLAYWISYGADGLIQYYSMYGLGSELPWDSVANGVTLADDIKDQALESAMLYALIPQEAKKAGLELSADFDTAFAAVLEDLNTQIGSAELADHYLWNFPLTREVYTELCRTDEYNAMLMEHLFGEGTDGYPTDAEVFQYLTEDQQCYFFKHILLMVEETTEGEGDAAVTTSNREEQLALAQSLRDQLAASDDPAALFEQLMNEYSQDTGLLTYPDGYIGSAAENPTVASRMVPVVEEFCLSAEDGQISEVLENDGSYHGFHIVMALPIEEHADPAEFRKTMISNQMTALQDQWLADNPAETTDAFKALDTEQVFNAISVLRTAINDEAMAAVEQSQAPADGAESTAP